MKIVCLFISNISTTLDSTEVETLSTNLVNTVRLSFVEKVKNNGFVNFVGFEFPKDISEITYKMKTTFT